MDWTQQNIDLYTHALTDLRAYVDLWTSIIVNEGWEPGHSWKIIEKRIHEATGQYRYGNYNSFKSAAHANGIKLTKRF